MRVLRLTYLSCVVLSVIVLASCSTSKNTATSRFYQSMVTRYNVFYNGNEAYKKGYVAQEKGIKDNYLDVIYMYPVSDPKVHSIGSGDFDLAIEKAQKGIKLHSITVKPKKKSGASEKEKQWYSKNEFNPFLWHAWFLLADAQFQKGEFIEAASTYSYIARLYADDPAIVAQANMKTAQCYSEIGWNYESEELFQRVLQGGIPYSLEKEYSARKASSLVRQERFDESIALLEKAIGRRGTDKLQKTREQFLLAQLYKATGQNESAYKAFRKVIRMNPPYQTEFSARILQTETMTGMGSKSQIKKLRRMERDPKNSKNIDQIKWAMGNIMLAQSDTVQALKYYSDGLEKSLSDTPEKGILLLTMAEIYWQQADYSRAGDCYSKAVGLIETTHKDYETIKLRSEVLDELSGHVETIRLQDSLQWLATLPEHTLDSIIAKVISDRKKADAEAAAKEAERARELERQSILTGQDMPSGSTEWYFYNPQQVQQGKGDFHRKWGNRKLEDNWRRENKTVLSMGTEDEPADSLAAAQDSTQNIEEELDSAALVALADPYSREFYLALIPRTEQELEESNRLITESLLGAGLIYKDRLVEYEMAEKSLLRLVNDYPESEEAVQGTYNLFLMYSLWGRQTQADSALAQITRNWPDNPLAVMLSDPDFEDNARYGKHREDSIYSLAYAAFLDGDTAAVMRYCDISANKYPKGANRSKFLFLKCVTELRGGDIQTFLSSLRDIVTNYPKDEISSLAGLIAEGIQEGRILQSTELGGTWDRQPGDLLAEQADSVRPEFSADRYQPFVFVLAYPSGSVNQNQLLFEVARYNFSNYLMRNFDLSFLSQQGVDMLKVSEFSNFDEAYTYRQNLYGNAEMAQKLEGMRAIIITQENLGILLSHYSFNDYQRFYEEHFLTIPELDIDGTTLFESYDDGTE